MDTVRRSLEENKIVDGILWDAISTTIASVNQSGQEEQNVLIAEIPPPAPQIHLSSKGGIYEGEEITELFKNLETIGDILETKNTDMQCPASLYCQPEEPCLQIHSRFHVSNILGETISIEHTTPSITPGEHIRRKNTQYGYELISKIPGFLVLTKEKTLNIYNPLQTSKDQMHLYYNFIPLISGQEQLIDAVMQIVSRNELEEFGELPEAISPTVIQALLDGDRWCRKSIREGVPPFSGENARIAFHINLERELKKDNQDRVDFKETQMYREISEGTVIAEKIPMQLPRPGKTVKGDLIPTGDVKDVSFEAKENIAEMTVDGKLLYVAQTTGILILKNHSAAIVEELLIKGDVSADTGNIHYSKNVIIGNNVCAGYTVECGGDLEIRGGIEDNVTIKCAGNLRVSKGIIGEKTRIKVLQNATIGYMQNSHIRCQGTIEINDYAYLSEIFCRGNLIIHGKTITNSEKGAVLGGRAATFSEMEIHSAGSTNTFTQLCCGMDPELFDALQTLRSMEPALKRKVNELQKKVGFALTDKHLKEKLNALSGDKKKETKVHLLNLKQAITAWEESQEKIKHITTQVYSEAPQEYNILIHKHLIPPVIVKFGRFNKRISSEVWATKIGLQDGEIRTMPL